MTEIPLVTPAETDSVIIGQQCSVFYPSHAHVPRNWGHDPHTLTSPREKCAGCQSSFILCAGNFFCHLVFFFPWRDREKTFGIVKQRCTELKY